MVILVDRNPYFLDQNVNMPNAYCGGIGLTTGMSLKQRPNAVSILHCMQDPFLTAKESCCSADCLQEVLYHRCGSQRMQNATVALNYAIHMSDDQDHDDKDGMQWPF